MIAERVGHDADAVVLDRSLYLASPAELLDAVRRLDAELDHVALVAHNPGITDFVNRHPRGFDMPISERGDSVSGGQRRCIAVARALVHRPGILLFDEPTGSMDNTTEAAVKKELLDYLPGRTLLLVTHRTSLLDLVDRIIVVDGGKVVADGAKDAVLEALQQGKIGKSR